MLIDNLLSAVTHTRTEEGLSRGLISEALYLRLLHSPFLHFSVLGMPGSLRSLVVAWPEHPGDHGPELCHEEAEGGFELNFQMLCMKFWWALSLSFLEGLMTMVSVKVALEAIEDR